MSCNKHESESKESTYVKKTVTDAKKDETSLNYEQKEDQMPVSDFSYHSEEQNKTKEIQLSDIIENTKRHYFFEYLENTNL